MAVESPLSQDLITTRNRGGGSELKKKLNKSRSIKLLSKACSLKPSSSRKSNSRYRWLSIDLSTDVTSSIGVDFSDSLPNFMKPTNSSDAKKDRDNSQGGSEIDDSTSVGSSSYGSLVSGLPALNQTSRIQKMKKTYASSRSFRRRAKSRMTQPSIVSSIDATTPQRSPSAQGLDGSLNYLKATSSSDGRKVSSLLTPENLESSIDSSDQSSSHSSKLKSGSTGRKSLQTLVRTPSVKVIMNKTSFKPKRSSLKCSPISEDLSVGRGTCSSILKGKRFPQHVELNSELTQVKRTANVKVCPYHHCSLHGHHHDPAPPPKRSLFMKRQSLKSRKSMKPVSESISGVKFSGSRGKDFPSGQLTSELEDSSQEVGDSSTFLTALKDDKDMGFSIEIHAKFRAHVSTKKADKETKDAKAVEIPLGDSFYQVQSHQEGLNQVMFSLIKTISDLKEKSEECSRETEKQKPSTEVDSNVHEVSAPNIGDRDQESTTDDTNPDHSNSVVPDLHVNPDDQVSTCTDNEANLVGESWKGEPLTFAEKSDDFGKSKEDKSTTSSTLGHNSLDDFKTSAGEKNHSSDPGNMLVTGPTLVGGSNASKLTVEGDSQSTGSHEGNHAHVNKDKHISMWHLIHKHMASSLAPDSDPKLRNKADEGNKIDATSILPAATISETKQSSSDLNTSADNHDATSQDIELRKVFAIKLVREAIEKILLPEVPDQSSDDHSVTRDAVSEQDHSEEFVEDSTREFEERKGENNASADLKKEGRDADNMLGVKKEKTGSKLKKESDKKAPKHWSNLKKWILLQRFIKALEKIRKFNPIKPQHLQLEPDPEAEKVSLRHQTLEDRKKAEEWMLDYALQQAINQLAPTQKKKVALLVKAFETVVPPQEDSGMNLSFPKLKETSGESAFSRKDVDESASQRGNTALEGHEILASGPDKEEKLSSDNTETSLRLLTDSASEVSSSVGSKPYDIMSPSPEKLSAGEKQKQDILKTDAPKEAVSNNEESEYSRGGNGSSPAVDGESEVCSETMSSVPENISLKNSVTSFEESKEESKMAHVNLEVCEDLTSGHYSESVGPVSTRAADGKPAGLSLASELLMQVGDEKSTTTYSAVCSISKSDVNDNEKDKKDHIRMWHMVYQHVVSNIAEKFGPKLLDVSDDEPEGVSKLSGFSMTNQDATGQKYATSLNSGFSRSEAIKLVQEAVDEILLPEIQDDVSEAESVTSDTVPYQELAEKNHSEGGDEKAFSSPELTKDDVGNSRGVTLLTQEEKGLPIEDNANQADKRSKSLDQTKSEPPKPKNWSKLRKMILLKRSIKALEKARAVKSQSQKNLPMANADSEKVDLRHQMMDERKKAEQWMLDYAVQNIVHQLTPARKRRVSMLVEAFEAVVPLPEI